MYSTKTKNGSTCVKTALLVLILVLALAMALPLAACQKKSETVTLKIGAQNYAEVITLAYMAEALIEDQSDYEVEVVPRLGSVVVLDQAMQTGDVDIASFFLPAGHPVCSIRTSSSR